jgi:thiol-disulfide isomerase/thioredoxin
MFVDGVVAQLEKQVEALTNPKVRPKGEMTQLADEEEYQAKIAEATAANKVCLIAFFASWCRACKATKPQIQRMVLDFPDVEFCALPFEKNKKLAKTLGIKALPYVVMIGGEKGQVESFQCGRSKIPLLKEKLQLHTGAEVG